MSGAQVQSQGLDEDFDSDVLAEIESRMSAEPSSTPAAGPGDKVELDKADLPLEFDDEPEPEPEPEVEVDLAPEPEPELATDLTESAKPAKPAGGKRRLIMIAAALVLLAGSAGGWYLLSTPKKAEPKKPPPWMFTGKMPDVDSTLRVDLKPFIVPLLDSGEGRILRVGISLEAVSPEQRMQVSQKVRMLRDLIYRVMRDRPANEVKTARGKRLLQAQIKTEVNHALRAQMVYRVFFTEFVITG